jgi:hypothetical protein
MYADLLGRQPNCDEINTFFAQLGQGMSRGDVALALTHTPEYRLRVVRDQVTRVLHFDASEEDDFDPYFTDLAAPPHAFPSEGDLAIDPYLDGLDQNFDGLPVNSLIVLAHILASSFHVRRHPDVVPVFPETVSHFVQVIYFDDLMVPYPSDPVEQQALVDAYGMAAPLGFPGATVLAALHVLPRYVPLLVEEYYQQFLHRVSDPGGFMVWTGALLTGGLSPEQVVAGFVGSQEYFNLAQT